MHQENSKNTLQSGSPSNLYTAKFREGVSKWLGWGRRNAHRTSVGKSLGTLHVEVGGVWSITLGWILWGYVVRMRDKWNWLRNV